MERSFMRKKIVFIIGLAIIIGGVIFSCFNTKDNATNQDITTDKPESISEESNVLDDVLNDDNAVETPSNEAQEISITEEKKDDAVKTEEKVVEKKETKTSASNSTSNNSVKKSENNPIVEEPKKDSKQEETKEIKEESISEKSNNLEENINTKEEIPDKKEEINNSNQEEIKTIEIVVEDSPKNYKNDPEYLKLKKELFSSNEECTSKGIEVNFQDTKNIAATMCNSVSYYGEEVGYRLFIRYQDGTYKEYKK